MRTKNKVITVVVVIVLIAGVGYWRGWFGRKKQA